MTHFWHCFTKGSSRCFTSLVCVLHDFVLDSAPWLEISFQYSLLGLVRDRGGSRAPRFLSPDPGRHLCVCSSCFLPPFGAIYPLSSTSRTAGRELSADFNGKLHWLTRILTYRKPQVYSYRKLTVKVGRVNEVKLEVGTR